MKCEYHVNLYDPVSGRSDRRVCGTLAEAIELAETAGSTYITAIGDECTDWEQCIRCGKWHISGEHAPENATHYDYCDRCLHELYGL